MLVNPACAGLDQNGAMLGERRLPYRYFLLVHRAPLACNAERRVTPSEIGAVMLERVKISAISQREHEIEIASPLGRRATHQLDVARREENRRERTECSAESSRF